MKAIIGLEIHAQLNTHAKIFCECSTNYGNVQPNTNICPVCTGQPGSKPMSINEQAISHVLKIAKMLNAKPILEDKIFLQRKHYFYPDLPLGYQRTSKPVAKNGKLNNVGIWEIHFEEDPGRYELKKGFVDYNRSGVPLVEIVTAPDIQSPENAKEFLAKLEAYLRYFNVIKEEAGTMRIDANISIENHSRVEIKNINSFSNVYTALLFEIKRQKTQIEQDVKLIQETRHFDENSGITVRLRTKEIADDYRYVPDPDVLPIIISAEDWKTAELAIAELPDTRAERLMHSLCITPIDAKTLVLEKEFADTYEQLVKKFDHKKLANWMNGPLRKQLNYRNLLFRNSGLNVECIYELYKMFSNGEITDKGMETILIKMLDSKNLEKTPKKIAEKSGLLKKSNQKELYAVCKTIIKQNPKAIKDYKTGNTKSIFFLIGKIMQETKGTVDAKEAEKALKELIK